MYRWLLVLVLSVASAPAWGQSADTTTRAYNASAAAARQVTQLSAQRNSLAQRWQDELRAVDRLKSSRSWNRDRELRAKLSDANELGKQLETAEADLRRAVVQLAAARRALISAIDAELAASPVAPRRAQLDKARAEVVPQTRRAHRIVLPDMQIDPLADPEELDQQATALRESEAELQKQIIGLETQGQELERIDILRKQHDRTKEMDQRDDNSSRRTAPVGTGRGGAEALGDNNPAPDAIPTSGGPAPSFEADVSIALEKVVDPSTLDTLNRAERTGDPGKRAAAAKQTRNAVAAKLDQLRAKRKQVEDRAKQLRNKR